MREDRNSYLQYVEDENIIEGNIDGMVKLRDAIDEAIRCGYVGLAVDPTSNIFGVSISGPESTSQPIKARTRTLISVVLGWLTFIWFVVLPFVAIGLSIYVLFFSDSQESVDHRSLYIQDILKEQYQNKRE